MALSLALSPPVEPAVAQQPIGGQATASADESQPTPVTPDERRALIDQIAQMLEQRYVFEDKGREAGRHLQRLQNQGAFEQATDPRDLAAVLTEQLQSITRDKHLRVNAVRLRGGPEGERGPGPGTARAASQPDPAERLMSPQGPSQGNWGFEKVESLEGNIGYLKIDGFASDPAARSTATAAMNFLAGHDALIIDLRENGGGNPSMIQYVCSYLFDKPTHLNSIYSRATDSTREFWTLSDVPGRRIGQEVPVFVLTSNYTFSGGEEMAYNLQTQKRGTLIGETTGGGANPGGRLRVGERFAIFIPDGRAINPITGTNWEGVGVRPEIEMPAAEAYDKALELAKQAAGEHREKRQQAVIAARREVVNRLRSASEALKRDPEQRVPELEAALRNAVERGALGEPEINVTGYGYLEAEQVGPALALLRFNVERFPQSANAHDSYGEALEKAGNLLEAEASYRKAIELAGETDEELVAEFRKHLERVTGALEQSRH